MDNDPKYQNFYDHISAPQFIKEKFSEENALFDELKKYGLDLMLRCLSSCSRKVKFEDSIILIVLLKHFLTMFDGIHTLFKECLINVAFIPARTILETSFFIEWIIVEDSHNKAKYYYVKFLREQLHFAENSINNKQLGNNL
ncbi:DUF5677 domain-containing protein, partial [Candidatus Latescibacterota bacterium]